MVDAERRAYSSTVPPLVGRERERAVLRERFATACAGVGSLVLVGGEAGIGKTALVEAFCREATERGAMALVGRCFDLIETPAYGPWLYLFDRYRSVAGLPDSPGLFTQRGGVGEATSQSALFWQVRDFLAALGGERPLILLLDDLHWGDPASLDLLRFLAQSIASLPLLILVTYRSDELTRRHPLSQFLPRLVREANADRLDLTALDDTAVRALVTARYALTEGETGRLVRYLQARAEGNAFFVGELLRALEETRLLRRDGGDGDGWALGELTYTTVPPLLRQVIDERVARLDAESQRLMTVAAIIGHEIPLDLWAMAGDVDEETLLDSVEQGVHARLLVEATDGERVQFAHALVREAVYEGELARRRRRVHRRVAELLAASAHPNAEAVAHHFQRAGDARAGAWLMRAGEQVEEAFAYETAAARFEEALPFLEGDPAHVVTQAEVYLRLARLRRFDQTRCVGYAQEALRLATASGDELLTVVARHRLGINTFYADHFREAIAIMEPGETIPDTLPATVADRFFRLDRISATGWYRHASYALRLAMVGRFAEAEQYAIAAQAEGERRQDIPANVGGALSIVYPALGRLSEARAMFARIRAHFLSTHEFVGLALMNTTEINWLVVPYQADEPSLRDPLINSTDVALQRFVGPYAGLPRAALLHEFYYLEGRWDDMPPLVIPQRTPYRAHGVTLARVALARGEMHAAWEIIGHLIPDGLATEPGTTWFFVTIGGQRLAAALALAAGDLATARSWLDAHDRWLAWSGAVLGQSEGQALWAYYYRQAADLEKAQEHAARALALATEPRQPLALMVAHRLLGELTTEAGRHEEAGGHLQTSLALADTCQAPYERALTLLAMAELRAATGERADALRLLDEVGAICMPLGAKPALARAAALAERLSATQQAPRVYPAGLSAREADVLRLVAAGLTNTEIADRLFLSIRTVETHIRAIYNKLGTSSRTVATRFALEHDLT